MRAIIFVNGELHDYDALAQLIQPDDYLIAADGGVKHCLAIHLTPHALIGDLDSVDPATVASLQQQGVTIERHPPDKNQTDLELALDHALAVNHASTVNRSSAVANRRTLQEIILVGGLGGRLDQMLGNVLILAQREWPLPLILIADNLRAQVVFPGMPLTLAATIGDTVSALPLSDQVTGITYTGMRYPLENHSLALGSTRGMSNEVVAVPATVEIASGRLLIIESG